MEACPSLAVASSLENSNRHMGQNVLPACHRTNRVFRLLMWGFPKFVPAVPDGFVVAHTLR